MHYTMFDYLTSTKGATYIVAALVMLSFIPFWRFLTAREKRHPGHGASGH